MFLKCSHIHSLEGLGYRSYLLDSLAGFRSPPFQFSNCRNDPDEDAVTVQVAGFQKLVGPGPCDKLGILPVLAH